MNLAHRQGGPLASPRRLGVIPTIAPFLLPRIVPRTGKAFPALKLYLREDTTWALHTQLMTSDLDLIRIALPYELRNVEVRPLFRDLFRLACRSGTRLIDPGNYRFNRLNADSVLLLEEGHCLRDHAISSCKLRNVDSISRFSATGLLTLVEMVDADLGITLSTGDCRRLGAAAQNPGKNLSAERSQLLRNCPGLAERQRADHGVRPAGKLDP